MRGADERTTGHARRLRRTQTDAEGRLWFRLRNRQLGGHKFIRQEPIGPYVADFTCREERLIVELDGDQHADSAHDAKRDAWLRGEGYRVLRFWNHEVMTNVQSVLDTIFAEIGERASAPPVSSPRERGEVAPKGSMRGGVGSSTSTLDAASAPHPVAAATRPLPARGERTDAARERARRADPVFSPPAGRSGPEGVDEGLHGLSKDAPAAGSRPLTPALSPQAGRGSRARRGKSERDDGNPWHMDIADRLVGFRGRIEPNAPLAPLSWFRTGGPADLLLTPVDADDLALALAAILAEAPLLVVGLGSNLLIRDGGWRGVAIRLGKGFGAIVADGLRVRAGAGAPDVKVARAAAEAGIAGLSFLRGIPGTIGGALRMNGGAYGGEVKDVLVEAVALDRQGRRVTLTNAEMNFSYRKAGVPDELIFIEALFEGTRGEPGAILAEMAAITEARSATQPVNTRTGGSTFKNPDGGKAWQLVDAAGCRGLTIGGAQVSPLHTNFLVNLGTATSADIENLGEEVRRRVLETSGVSLEWEIKRVGEP